MHAWEHSLANSITFDTYGSIDQIKPTSKKWEVGDFSYQIMHCPSHYRWCSERERATRATTPKPKQRSKLYARRSSQSNNHCCGKALKVTCRLLWLKNVPKWFFRHRSRWSRRRRAVWLGAHTNRNPGSYNVGPESKELFSKPPLLTAHLLGRLWRSVQADFLELQKRDVPTSVYRLCQDDKFV